MAVINKIAKDIGVSPSSLIMEDNVLKAEFGSDKTPLKLGSLELPCYVLEDGTRVFSGRSIQKAIGSTATSGTWITKFINSPAIKMNLQTSIFEKLSNPIPFKRNASVGSQSVTYGCEAALLIDLCNAIIDAGNDRRFEIDADATIIVRAVQRLVLLH